MNDPDGGGFYEGRANVYYARVGRVVTHAALMEQWTLYLAWTLDRTTPQQVHAGRHGTDLTMVCRDHLDVLGSALRGEVESLLEDLDAVLRDRNVVVHSVAVQPGDEVAYAHRPLPKRQRVNGDGTWIADAYLTAEHLDALDDRILEIIERLMKIRPLAERM